MRQLTSKLRSQRGDTIIEVIFAIVIFAFVAISAVYIMNRGVAAGEKALEITLVRQQVNAQTEALRYIHAARVVDPTSEVGRRWDSIIANYGQAEASLYGVEGRECSIPSDRRPFILNARKAEVWTGTLEAEYGGEEAYPPYSQVRYTKDDTDDANVVDAAYGIWIEAIPSALNQTPEVQDEQKKYVDFHIRACWPAPGSAIPMTIGTIVRLYEPAI